MERFTVRQLTQPLGWRQVRMLQSIHLAERPMSLADLRKMFAHQRKMAVAAFGADVASALVTRSLINRQYVDGEEVFVLTQLGKDVAIETLAGR